MITVSNRSVVPLTLSPSSIVLGRPYAAGTHRLIAETDQLAPEDVVKIHHGNGTAGQARPCSKANAVAADRDETASLAKMFWTWRATVCSLITSSMAI